VALSIESCVRAIPEFLYPVVGEHAFQSCIPWMQKKGEALAAEVRAVVASAAKSRIQRQTLKCTAEAVLHPDTPTQNLL
jgi:hypothetical protein